MSFSSQIRTYVIILFIILLLSGCSKSYDYTPHATANHNQLMKEQVSRPTFPITVEDGFFQTAVGFIDKQTLLFVTERDHHSAVCTYHLPTGKLEHLYENDYPIHSVEISPNNNYILIHSSPTNFQALITIIDSKGKLVFQKELPSMEIFFDWNQVNENKLLITAFNNDWTFDVFELRIDEGSLAEIPLEQPFGYWLGESELLYLNWSENPALVAPLHTYDTERAEIKEFGGGYYHIDTYFVDSLGDLFFTVTIDEDNYEEAIYTFYNSSHEVIFSYTVPHLSRYSGYLVPYYSFILEKNKFLTFEPLYYTEVDVYWEGFQLVEYDLQTKERTVLMEGMDNEPLNCAPDGRYCLSGFYLEKLIDFSASRVEKLVEW